jgi:GT2 family glycosyltransferase
MLPVEILIKSFLRPETTVKCIRSIRQHYNNRILVADDSNTLSASDLFEFDNVELHQLEYDVGLSAGRNYLLDRVTTPYFLLLDNDFMIDQKDTLENMLAILHKEDATLVSGTLWDYGKPHPRAFVGYFTFEHSMPNMNFYDMNKIKFRSLNKKKYLACRFCENFFLARKDNFDQYNIRWDDSLKHQEHEDFFIKFSSDLRIIFSPDIWVRHAHCHVDSGAYYTRFRFGKRQTHFRKIVAARYGLPFNEKQHHQGMFFPHKYGMVYDWENKKFPLPLVKVL